jgi:ABC-2 type transport system ATP-binding protein
MNPDNAIEVRDVRKYFKVYDDKGKMLRERIIHWNRNHYEKREVLKGISFDVKKGEAVGLIGKNGCGKSTTLKLLTKILRPNSGSIETNGKIYSMIELGAGFHPDMSGRENIYINASIYGVKAKEVDKRLNDIIEFSELEEYIDNPVRTYSSGMYMRLAFAIAINMNADILLIDEILAVGDINFQQKCFNKLYEVKKAGTTIVIVSHSLDQIEKICDKCYWIDKGQIKASGKPKIVNEAYLSEMDNQNAEREKKHKKQKAMQIDNEGIIKDKISEKLPDFCSELSIRIGNRDIEFIDVKLLNSRGEETTVFENGEDIEVKMKYKSNKIGLEGNFGIAIYREDGLLCYGTNIFLETEKAVVTKEQGEVVIKIHKNVLLGGNYMLDVAIHSLQGLKYDDIRNITPFTIKKGIIRDEGVCRLENTWSISDF